GLSESRANVARTAAHFAIQKPYEITELVDFKDNPDIKELTKAVYVDFGGSDRSSPAPWNNMTAVSAGTAIELNDEDGTDLGIELTVKQSFQVSIVTEQPLHKSPDLRCQKMLPVIHFSEMKSSLAD